MGLSHGQIKGINLHRALWIGVVDAIVWIWFIHVANTSRFTDFFQDMSLFNQGNVTLSVVICVVVNIVLISSGRDSVPSRYRAGCAFACFISTGCLVVAGFSGGFPNHFVEGVVFGVFAAAYNAAQILRLDTLSKCGDIRTLLVSLATSLVAYYIFSACVLSASIEVYMAFMVLAPFTFVVSMRVSGGFCASSCEAAGDADACSFRPNASKGASLVQGAIAAWRSAVRLPMLFLLLFGIAGGLVSSRGLASPAASMETLFESPSPMFLVMVLVYMALGIILAFDGGLKRMVHFSSMGLIWVTGSFAGSGLNELFPAIPDTIFAVFAGGVGVGIVVLFAIAYDARSSSEADSSGHVSVDSRTHVIESLALAKGLTPRECDILRLLADGRSVPYIRDALVISEGTVKTHVKHIYSKLDVHSRQELIDLLQEISQRGI